MVRSGLSGAWLPAAQELVEDVRALALQHAALAMLGRTHGQPASHQKWRRAGGKTLFLSPQSAAGTTLEDQVNGAIGKMKASLGAAGMKLSDVVSTQVSLKDVGDFSRMNAVYRKHFAKDPPARTTIQLTPADPSSQSMVEISCIAVK